MVTVSSIIADQPEISTHSTRMVVLEGSDLLLTCNATGNPTPLISWTKDGFLINASGDPRIIFTEQNSKLSITNVSHPDVGQYRCVASNSLGNATSIAAILDVQCNYTKYTREVFTPFTTGNTTRMVSVQNSWYAKMIL